MERRSARASFAGGSPPETAAIEDVAPPGAPSPSAMAGGKEKERAHPAPTKEQGVRSYACLKLKAGSTLNPHPEEPAISAFTRVFDALWRASKGDGPNIGAVILRGSRPSVARTSG